jgi:hypothetical protein
MRQALVDLYTEYPEHHVEEIARIMYMQFGRRPSAQSIKLTLAAGPKPSRITRRFPLFAEMTDPRERRLAIIQLHAEGWTPTSIAGYLETSRQTVYATLKRWISEQFAGLVGDIRPMAQARGFPPSRVGFPASLEGALASSRAKPSYPASTGISFP